jgi:WD40 repeat protein
MPTSLTRPIFALLAAVAGVVGAAEPDFNTAVAPLFDKYCMDCHSATDPEHGLVLETYDSLMKGGESGPAIKPREADESLLVKFLEGRSGKQGRNQFMPPGKAKKLNASEMAVIKAWINAGALPPKESAVAVIREISVPKIVPKVTPRRTIHSVAHGNSLALIAVAYYGEVELRSEDGERVLQKLKGHSGHVNAVTFSADGTILAAAGGEPGLFGEVRLWKTSDGSLVRAIRAHKDALYSVAISPNGKVMATGSYDQKIKLWDMVTGVELRELSGHNGAVFGLSFRRDGVVLASASGDRTVKLWDVATGKRLDTLSQATKEIYAVGFAPDGRHLVAGGADNRIRFYAISASALDGSNELLISRFAHEGSILSLVYSPNGSALASSGEDRTVKVWDGEALTERLILERQPDIVPAVTFVGGAQTVVAGRLDGTLQFYKTADGKAVKTAAR